MQPHLRLTICLVALLVAGGCSTQNASVILAPSVAGKIQFRLDDIGPDGLRGPPAGKVSVAYEFCAPDTDDIVRELKQIDPSLTFQPGSPGRIGCSGTQTLCLGETHQPRWREILQSLASLDYVAEIRPCHFE